MTATENSGWRPLGRLSPLDAERAPDGLGERRDRNAARGGQPVHPLVARPPPQAHSGAKVKAAFGRYNFPFAVRPRADEPPPPANPWGVGHVEEGTSP